MNNTNEEIIIEEGIVTTLTINKPKSLNALNLSVITKLRELVADLNSKDDVRVLVLKGSGDKAFVAGADVKAMQESGVDELKTFISAGQSLMREIENSAKVSVAAVDGYALGGGLELALACDIIFASEGSSFALPEVSLGLIPGFGGTQRLQRRVGSGFAKYMTLTGKIINANIAFKKGIVDVLASEESYEDDLAKLAKGILKNSAVAQGYAKTVIDKYQGVALEEGLKFEEKKFIEVFQEEEAKEGMLAFIENRKPNF
jgi:enoyl-CoA hydratase